MEGRGGRWRGGKEMEGRGDGEERRWREGEKEMEGRGEGDGGKGRWRGDGGKRINSPTNN